MLLIHRFRDGTELLAVPEPDADVIGQLHDLVHGLVAEALGLECSPVLWRVAHALPLDSDLTRYEEAAVLAIQAFARALRREMPCTDPRSTQT